jgi:16S rRNA (cytosine1402-N4)-methyltransferase
MDATVRNATKAMTGLSLRRMALYRQFVGGPLACGVDMPEHAPVMVVEVLAAMGLKPGDVVIDGTLGLGGHTLHFIKAVAPGGTAIGFDWDASMLEIARARIGNPDFVRFVSFHSDFRSMGELAEEWKGKVNAVLLDLGLNSAQIDDPARGLSFREPGVLDMRMDRSTGEPASALLNRWTPAQIEEVLKDYGDERWARAISKKIVERRKENPLRTTDDLVDCVLAAIPPGARDKRIHPATRTFQAVRIAVNRELDNLDEALVDAAQLLAVGGTLVVLAYHSGEDRIVKNTFRKLASEGGFEEASRKPLSPGEQEVHRNPRSRSAKLRALRRIEN